MPNKNGAKKILKDSPKRPRKPTSESQGSLLPNTSNHLEEEQKQPTTLHDLLNEANPKGEDVTSALGAQTRGMGSVAMGAAILIDESNTFPITVRQANALLVELEHEWIRDREIVGGLIRSLREWLATLSNGSC